LRNRTWWNDACLAIRILEFKHRRSICHAIIISGYPQKQRSRFSPWNNVAIVLHSSARSRKALLFWTFSERICRFPAKSKIFALGQSLAGDVSGPVWSKKSQDGL
jgi:hypothetical protein